MKKRPLIILGGVIAVLAVLAVTWTRVSPVWSAAQDSTPTPSGIVTLGPVTFAATPMPPQVTDLAPSVATRDKAEIIIRHPDGSREGFLLSMEMIDAFIKRLPPGDRIETLIPPQALVGKTPPMTIPPSGVQTYPVTPGPAVATPPSGP